MRRLLLVLSLAGPVFAAGLVALAVAAWALVAVGLNGLVSPLLVLGLAASVPLSIVAADRIVPGSPAGVRPTASCPHCGGPFVVGSSPKPDPAWWL